MAQNMPNKPSVSLLCQQKKEVNYAHKKWQDKIQRCQ